MWFAIQRLHSPDGSDETQSGPWVVIQSNPGVTQAPKGEEMGCLRRGWGLDSQKLCGYRVFG